MRLGGLPFRLRARKQEIRARVGVGVVGCSGMEVSHSVKERTISENSLVLLLQGLCGRVTQVELRDESLAEGRVASVDAFMNIRLGPPATFTDRAGRTSRLEGLFLTGRNVRYVHIPDEVDIRGAIEGQLRLLQRLRGFGGAHRGRKEFLRPRDRPAGPQGRGGHARGRPSSSPARDPESPPREPPLRSDPGSRPSHASALEKGDGAT